MRKSYANSWSLKLTLTLLTMPHPTNPKCNSNMTKLASFQRTGPQHHPNDAMFTNTLYIRLGKLTSRRLVLSAYKLGSWSAFHVQFWTSRLPKAEWQSNTQQHNNCFMALCPGLPGWAGTRRNTHPPTILLIIQSLSASSIYHDP